MHMFTEDCTGTSTNTGTDIGISTGIGSYWYLPTLLTIPARCFPGHCHKIPWSWATWGIHIKFKSFWISQHTHSISAFLQSLLCMWIPPKSLSVSDNSSSCRISFNALLFVTGFTLVIYVFSWHPFILLFHFESFVLFCFFSIVLSLLFVIFHCDLWFLLGRQAQAARAVESFIL